jgi:hypothetical protein
MLGLIAGISLLGVLIIVVIVAVILHIVRHG